MVCGESPVGSLRLLWSASTGVDVRHRGSGSERRSNLQNDLLWFVGIDWGSEKHRICLLNREGEVVEKRWIEHSGHALTELADWLRQTIGDASRVAAAIEVPRGAIVETLLEHGYAVFYINPKQLDRFRDRFSPAGAKDDDRDAWVLADGLRTDPHCFHTARLDQPARIRLRELSRLQDDLNDERRRLANQLWEQLHRYFPCLLQLSSAADEPWLWDLLQSAPTPARAARLSSARVQAILRQHRIRRLNAAQVITVLASKPLTLAPGAVEAASEHVAILLPRLRLVHQQHQQVAQRIEALLQQLAASSDAGPENREHRDVAILQSLPGVGSKVAATMLSEASQAIAERDYHALRCYAGVAPVTRQSGKKKVVLMRQACNERLRNALYHWTFNSIIRDAKAKQDYAQARARGQSHARALRGIAGTWLEVLISMLRHDQLYDPARRAA